MLFCVQTAMISGDDGMNGAMSLFSAGAALIVSLAGVLALFL